MISKTEYDLCKEIHLRDGEILELRYAKSKQSRDIERLEAMFVERDELVGTCLRCLGEDLDTDSKQSSEIERLKDMFAEKDELVGTCVSRIGEHLQENAKQSLEIERLNARISKILETTPDVQETDQGDQIDKITELENMFEYLKALLIELSHKEGNAPIDPDEIDVEYVETACRYCFPTLFDRRALLGNNDLRKIEFMDSILAKFDVKTMAKYEELVERGDVDVIILDHRCDVAEMLPVRGSREA